MASGKTSIGMELADLLGFPFIDLDQILESETQESIDQIFAKKGEVYFRKLEHQTLKHVLQQNEKGVLSLGGGTPCFSNNLELLLNRHDVKTVFLKASVQTLTERLFQDRSHRPLLSHIETKEELSEYIGKHLFERTQYYNQADLVLDANRSEQEILESLLFMLF